MSDEITKVVEKINESIFMAQHHEHVYTVYLEQVNIPIGTYVKFMGAYIYDSENDYRYYIKVDGEETEEIEDLKTYLLEQMQLVQDGIGFSIKAAKGE